MMTKRISKLLLALMLFSTTLACRKGEVVNNLKACPIKITMLIDEQGFDDNFPATATWQAIAKYLIDHGMNLDCAKYVQVSETKQYDTVISAVIYDGSDLLVFSSESFRDSIVKAAKKNTSQKFMTIGFLVDAPNIASVEFSKKEGSYLLGLASGLKAQESGKSTIAIVNLAGSDKYSDYIKGFTSGVKEIMPTANIVTVELKSLQKDKVATVFTEELFGYEPLVIFNPIVETNDLLYDLALKRYEAGHKHYLLGLNPSYYSKGLIDETQSLVLTSYAGDYDVAVSTVFNTLLDATFHGGAKNAIKFTILNNGVSVILIPDRNLSEQQINTIKEYINRIKTGELSID